MKAAAGAAGAAVDCAVVCCCPCGIANMMIMTMVMLPAYLFRKTAAMIKRKKSKPEVGDVGARAAAPPESAELLFSRERSWEGQEEEIWEPFYSTGFWRTLSRGRSSSSPRY